nr:immunoglobulin light chain junction region [Macaca mulatta]
DYYCSSYVTSSTYIF